jgi:hypothetical protein
VFTGASALAAALALPEVRADYYYPITFFQSSGYSNILNLNPDPGPGFASIQKVKILHFFPRMLFLLFAIIFILK